VGAASGAFYYPDDDADWAATAYQDNVYRAVYFAFGFEAISTREGRRETMRRVLEFLGPCPTLDIQAMVYLPVATRL
jgi:hypothetical protein